MRRNADYGLHRGTRSGSNGAGWRHGLVNLVPAFHTERRTDYRGSSRWPDLLERVIPRLEHVCANERTPAL